MCSDHHPPAVIRRSVLSGAYFGYYWEGGTEKHQSHGYTIHTVHVHTVCVLDGDMINTPTVQVGPACTFLLFFLKNKVVQSFNVHNDRRRQPSETFPDREQTQIILQHSETRQASVELTHAHPHSQQKLTVQM